MSPLEALHILTIVILMGLSFCGIVLLIYDTILGIYNNISKTNKTPNKPPQNPEIIVVSKGYKIQDQAQFLCDCMPKPKFKRLPKTSGPSKRRSQAQYRQSSQP